MTFNVLYRVSLGSDKLVCVPAWTSPTLHGTAPVNLSFSVDRRDHMTVITHLLPYSHGDLPCDLLVFN